jgi:hypothetical protein
MAESVHQAKQDLHHARDAQRERAAAFWQRAVNEGRILRQSGALMRKEQAEADTEVPSASQAP